MLEEMEIEIEKNSEKPHTLCFRRPKRNKHSDQSQQIQLNSVGADEKQQDPVGLHEEAGKNPVIRRKTKRRDEGRVRTSES